MKKKILLLCILTLFFSTGMDGCPDSMIYVEFTLTTHVNVFYDDTEGNSMLVDAKGTQIKIVTEKDGGERCEEIETVEGDYAVTLQCTHNVFNQQPVKTWGNVVSIPDHIYEMGWEYVETVSTPIQYSWEVIYDRCNDEFGTSCADTVIIDLVIVMRRA